jgi:LmbE family N-acetylglucosaminyl deacetylase
VPDARDRARRALQRGFDATSRRLLRRSHRIFHRLPVELVDAGDARTLVLAPHMDDEVIGPGGTVLAAVAGGAEVGVVVVSDGREGLSGPEGEAHTARRTEESRAAAELMGTDLVDVLGHPDGALCRVEPAIATDLERLLARWAPRRVMVPFPTDHHRDHQATAAAFARAVEAGGWDGEVWGYEAWSTLWPNVSVDISDRVDDKRAALRCFGSQVGALGYVDATIGLNAFRGLRVGVAHAEAFHRSSASAHVRLCDRLIDRIA